MDCHSAISSRLNDVVKGVDKNIEKRKREIERLANYKKSLIYEVVTGKKEV